MSLKNASTFAIKSSDFLLSITPRQDSYNMYRIIRFAVTDKSLDDTPDFESSERPQIYSFIT